MSAIPPKADTSWACPLCAKSGHCHGYSITFIGAGEQCQDGQPERLSGLEIDDDQRELIWSLFNVEPHALRERKLHPEIDRVGGPTHIGLPHVGAGLTTAAGLLLSAKGAADLGSRRSNVHVGDAAVRARRRNKSLCLAHIERKDGRGEARADSVVRPNGLTKFGITHHIENRRKGFA